MLGSCDKMRPSVEVATSVFTLDVHMVPALVFASPQLDRMEEIMGAVCADFGCELIEFNGRGQHLHLLVSFPRRWRRPGWSQ
jgi:REP element-mobilizing transposase RayT